MAYDEWTIGGYTPSWIVDVDYTPSNREFKINCIADTNRLSDADPRTEIEQFEALACDVISNTQLMSGGSVLQVCNGDPIMISDGVNAWVGALHRVDYKPDYTSKRWIPYTLHVAVETVGDGTNYIVDGGDPTGAGATDDDDIPDADNLGSKTYYRSFFNRSNITYYNFTDMTNSSFTPTYGLKSNYSGWGDNVGYMQISETRNVKQVIIYGGAIITPAWIEVNGQRQNWIKSSPNSVIWYAERNSIAPQTQDYGNETLTFTITPSSTVTITTSNHIEEIIASAASFTYTNNKGSYIDWVKVVYE